MRLGPTRNRELASIAKPHLLTSFEFQVEIRVECSVIGEALKNSLLTTFELRNCSPEGEVRSAIRQILP